MKLTVYLTLFVLTCIGALFTSSTKFIDSQLFPKWFTMMGGLLLIGYYSIIHFLFNLNKEKHLPSAPKPFAIIIICALLSQAVYGILQYMKLLPSTNTFQVTGSFDNPAGFAASLCAGFPFCILGIAQTKGKIRWLFIAALMLVVMGIVFSESRAGILSIIIASSYWIGKHIQLSFKVKKVLFPILILGIITGLYYYKKDSADGRILIWRCSVSLLKENLLTGGGMGTFESHYMDHQAKYFREYPTSPYSMLADNVQYPFCEYLNIGINYGIIGLCFVFCIIGFMFRRYFIHQTLEKETAFLCWLIIAIFALFSYPLMYPFVWLILLYSTYLLTRELIYKLYKYLSIPIKLPIVITIFSLLTYSGIQVFHRIEAELEWKKISVLSYVRNIEEVLSRYKKVYATLKTDRYFLYNYSMELYQAGRYRESLTMALQCRKYWADYDVEMLCGELYEHLQQPGKSEQHYQWASYMCPNRFMPLYKKALLLMKQNRLIEAKQIAREIINKPEKVSSPIVSIIKREMKILFPVNEDMENK